VAHRRDGARVNVPSAVTSLQPTHLSKTQERECAHFVETGEHDHLFSNWPGGPIAGGKQGDAALRSALTHELEARTKGIPPRFVPYGLDLERFSRATIEPMVRGLFPRNERELVLERLTRSIVFVDSASIASVLRETLWLSTAWDLANLYLQAMGVAPLSEIAPRIVGLSEATSCYVSVDYFEDAAPCENFVIHEIAHVFHNCKRRSLGLRETRLKEWPLDIEFKKRELFAYLCEAYGCLLVQGRTLAERMALIETLMGGQFPPDDRVDQNEFFAILRATLCVRNGWKRIYAHCRAAPLPTIKEQVRMHFAGSNRGEAKNP